MINAALFDLDGTLLDTAKDFAYAINLMRKKMGQSPVDFKALEERVYGAHNTNNMVSFAFDIPIEDPAFNQIKKIFIETYQENCTQETDYFPGIPTLLNYLDKQQIPCGIVTNKPGFLTQPIAKHFGLDKRAACIISGDTLAQQKPDPAPLLHACQLAQITPEKTVYIGDLQTDIMAAKAAKMPSVIASYGYCARNADLNSWGGNHIAKTPQAILTWLLNNYVA